MGETCDKCGIVLDTPEAVRKHNEEAHKVDPADVHSVATKRKEDDEELEL